MKRGNYTSTHLSTGQTTFQLPVQVIGSANSRPVAGITFLVCSVTGGTRTYPFSYVHTVYTGNIYNSPVLWPKLTNLLVTCKVTYSTLPPNSFNLPVLNFPRLVPEVNIKAI